MKNNDQTFLGQEKLGRLMGKYSVPLRDFPARRGAL